MVNIRSLKMEIAVHSLLLSAALLVVFATAAAWRYHANDALDAVVDANHSIAHIDAMQERARWVSRAATAAAATVSLLIVALLGKRLERRIALPLSSLESEVGRLRADNAEELPRGDPDGPEEIRRLREAFLQMAARVRLQHSVLARLSEMRRRVVSMMGHEFGNAMTGLLGGLTLLEEIKDISEQDQVRFTRMVRENAKSLQRMSEEFIGLVQSESGVFDFPISAVQIVPLVRRSLEAMEYKCSQRGIRVETRFPDEEVLVRGNAAVLGFALSNLIGNAVKYSRAQGVVSVSVDPAGGKVRVEVADGGIGMGAEDLRQALEGGFRSAAAQRMASGFGIGLSLVRDAVAGHGSALEAASEPGKGSRFWFELPVAAKETAGSSETALSS